MSGDPISRPEFDLYMKMSAESNQQTSRAITAIQEQGQETLAVLKEYTIHNNHKHDETKAEQVKQAIKIRNLTEAVKANTNVSKFWRTVQKYGKYIVIGGLTVLGGLIATQYYNSANGQVEINDAG